MSTNQQKLSAGQRAIYFQQATRQNIMSLNKKTAENNSIVFELPKARYLATLYLDVTAKIKCTHATKTSIPTDDLTLARLLRRVRLDLNNGFAPFDISGTGLKILSYVTNNASKWNNQSSSKQGVNYLPDIQASASGTENEVSLFMEVPITLNPRDPVGLLLLQSNQSLVNLSIDFSDGSDLFPGETGLTCTVSGVMATLTAETFSVPADENCRPDLSTVKLAQSEIYQFQGQGQNNIDLRTGMIYRKMAFRFLDNDKKPFKDVDFNSNIEIVFNTSDCNYSINASTLRHLNQINFGKELPEGVFILDLTNQGTPNLGGSRDLIDTKQLTSMTLRFNSTKAGTVEFIHENVVIAQA